MVVPAINNHNGAVTIHRLTLTGEKSSCTCAIIKARRKVSERGYAVVFLFVILLLLSNIYL